MKVKALNLGKPVTIHSHVHGYASFDDGLTFYYSTYPDNQAVRLFRSFKYGKHRWFRSQNHELALWSYLSERFKGRYNSGD